MLPASCTPLHHLTESVQGKAKGCFPSELPRDVSVLVTHGPPQRIFQNKKKTAGCPELTALLDEASAPAVHVCGHLHRAHGVYTHRAPSTSASIVVVNASTVSGALSPVNPPIVFEICRHTMPFRFVKLSIQSNVKKLNRRRFP